ncbi:hypothetical protein [Halomarina pelagica]|uniref:hypothetical protein n=1 Tax=Halomarina pelagica TaxID=2961599 RepID=UPI0020C34D1A|nr:hypothetical protein [Halomarina sp. BND7]
MSDEPDWMRMLHHLYENGGRISTTKYVYQRIDGEFELVDPNAPDAQLGPLLEDIRDEVPFPSVQEALDALQTLDRLDLAEWEDSGGSAYLALNQRGFDVIHERELRKQQHELTEAQNEASHRMVALTFFLVLVSVLQAGTALFSMSWGIGKVIMALLTLLTTAVVLFYAFFDLPKLSTSEASEINPSEEMRASEAKTAEVTDEVSE